MSSKKFINVETSQLSAQGAICFWVFPNPSTFKKSLIEKILFEGIVKITGIQSTIEEKFIEFINKDTAKRKMVKFLVNFLIWWNFLLFMVKFPGNHFLNSFFFQSLKLWKNSCFLQVKSLEICFLNVNGGLFFLCSFSHSGKSSHFLQVQEFGQLLHSMFFLCLLPHWNLWKQQKHFPSWNSSREGPAPWFHQWIEWIHWQPKQQWIVEREEKGGAERRKFLVQQSQTVLGTWGILVCLVIFAWGGTWWFQCRKIEAQKIFCNYYHFGKFFDWQSWIIIHLTAKKLFTAAPETAGVRKYWQHVVQNEKACIKFVNNCPFSLFLKKLSPKKLISI